MSPSLPVLPKRGASPFSRGVWCGVLVLAAVLAGTAAAELTEAQRDLLRQSTQRARQAWSEHQAGRHATAAGHLLHSTTLLEEALRDADPDVYDQVATLVSGIERVHVALQLEGLVLPPLERPEHGREWTSYVTPETLAHFEQLASTEADANTPAMARDASTPDAEPETPRQGRRSRRERTRNVQPQPAAISFTRQVAPILIEHCGQCHIQQQRGQFTLASYAALMQGPPEGVVVFPGDPVGSRLIETIETGDMPRGGGRVPDEQLKTLKDWVTQGARFDGPAPAVPLVAYARPVTSASPSPASDPAMDTPADGAASDGEGIDFARQIAPLLVDNCVGCHVDAAQPRGGLNMNTITQWMRGGDSGAVITPGDGDGSLLVRKLRGMEGARMPAGGRPPLADESIQLISQWITDGARTAGVDPEQPLAVMVTQSWAKDATPEELSARRQELAQRNWRLGAPEESRARAVQVEGEEVLVVGNVRQDPAESIARAASEALARAATAVPPSRDRSSGAGAFPGRITLFVFARRYDYSEFAKMVEAREIPAAWDAHWRFDGVDAYVALVADEGEDSRALRNRLVGPMASLMVASRGPSPHWFREGLGRAVAARLGGRDLAAIERWETTLRQAVASIQEPAELVGERLPPEHADALGYGLAQRLVDRRARKPLESLLAALEAETPFEEAFAAAFQMPLENYVAMWVAWYRTQP